VAAVAAVAVLILAFEYSAIGGVHRQRECDSKRCWRSITGTDGTIKGYSLVVKSQNGAQWNSATTWVSGNVSLTGTVWWQWELGYSFQRGYILVVGGTSNTVCYNPNRRLGKVTLTGTGSAGTGTNSGIGLNSGTVRSENGDIALSGTGVGTSINNDGINFRHGRLPITVQATGKGNISLTGKANTNAIAINLIGGVIDAA
jgi:hypothetical protein